MKKFIAIPLIFCLFILCSCSNVKTTKKTAYDDNGMPYDSITITGPGASISKDLIIKSNTTEGKIEQIAARAFIQCNKIESVNIQYVDIGKNAFAECANLKSATFNSCEIGENAFYNCDSLENLTFKGHCVIGESSFKSCNNLKSLVIDSGSIGESAFYSCSNLKSITIGSLFIGDYAFYNCHNLENVTLTSTYVTIEQDAFLRCSKHITINFSGTTQKFKERAREGLLSIDGGITVKCTNGNLYYN